MARQHEEVGSAKPARQLREWSSAREEDVLLEVQLRNARLQRHAQFAVAGDHEADSREAARDLCGRVDQVEESLLDNEPRDGAGQQDVIGPGTAGELIGNRPPDGATLVACDGREASQVGAVVDELGRGLWKSIASHQRIPAGPRGGDIHAGQAPE